MIQNLAPNQVFVFGSNTQGKHGKGAALTAKINSVQYMVKQKGHKDNPMR